MSNLPLNFWFSTYMKSLFVLSNTYNPGEYFTVKVASDSMKCYIISVVKLLPDSELKEKIKDFVVMTSRVSTMLINELPIFFSTFPGSEYKKTMINDGSNFLHICAENKTSMFNWVYLLQAYIYLLFNQKPKIPTLKQMIDEYEPKNMSKSYWGRPLWFVIHMSALYAPEPLQVSFEDYRSLLNCLQNLLPCLQCREHLRTNLKNINLDKCAKTNYDLFKCSVKLHNIVNKTKDVVSSEISNEEALKFYIPK